MDIYELAEVMHKHLCRWNHTDGCTWFYEGTDWERWAHKRWLEKAYKVEADTDMPLRDISKVVEAL